MEQVSNIAVPAPFERYCHTVTCEAAFMQQGLVTFCSCMTGPLCGLPAWCISLAHSLDANCSRWLFRIVGCFTWWCSLSCPNLCCIKPS